MGPNPSSHLVLFIPTTQITLISLKMYLFIVVILKILVWSHICRITLTGGEDRLLTSPPDVTLSFKSSAEDVTGSMTNEVAFKANAAYTMQFYNCVLQR